MLQADNGYTVVQSVTCAKQNIIVHNKLLAMPVANLVLCVGTMHCSCSTVTSRNFFDVGIMMSNSMLILKLLMLASTGCICDGQDRQNLPVHNMTLM